MTRFYDQEICIEIVGEYVELRVGEVALMLTLEQAKQLAARIDRVIPSSDMILRPSKPDYRVGK